MQNDKNDDGLSNAIPTPYLGAKDLIYILVIEGFRLPKSPPLQCSVHLDTELTTCWIEFKC